MTEIASQTAPAETTESAPVTTETPEVITAEKTTEPAPVTEETVATETPETTEPTAEKGSEPKSVKELKAQRKARQKAEQEAAYWRGVAEALKGSPKTETVETKEPELVEPKLDDFEDYEAFRAAQRKYDREIAKREVKAELAERDKSSTVKAQEDRVKADFEAMIEAQAEDDPEFPDVVKEMGDRITPVMGRAIMEHKQAADLIRYFNNNPKVEKEITKLSLQSPLAAASRIGEIAFELRTKPKPEPPKKVTDAPAPIPTVKSTTSPEILVDEDDLPMAEYINRKNAKQFGNRWKDRRTK